MALGKLKKASVNIYFRKTVSAQLELEEARKRGRLLTQVGDWLGSQEAVFLGD